ncbi:LamB/YcsF family protein [Pseudoflavitalea sp. G-6-1-2]|uniref:LamB/YcsF family protein n=1 Tax=Pseudoflavitalea sp. G-6-1-2 TaxID=2728841 RepID=UPI00146F7BF9|nr:5-oxoprolinase subunit PxpA [Pseudoflavitalea sp. G-6-1-2]NML21535.1 LamB/YcsF family protein [Pseudoflavitalea sp. G-6-1-2]
MLRIDINCDMGERSPLWDYSVNRDLSLLSFVSSINLACGFHAGDASVMHTMVRAAMRAGVAIGAHPSFDDRENFGRVNRQLSPEEIYDIVLYQLGSLHAFVQVNNAILHHVKPHGALYNMAAKDKVIAKAICDAVYDFDGSLILYGLAGSELINAAKETPLTTCSEVFADRSYQDDGSLTPRDQPGALITNQSEAIAQVLQMVQQQNVRSVSGKTVPVIAETICIHGDGLHALQFAESIHEALTKANIEITDPVKR